MSKRKGSEGINRYVEGIQWGHGVCLVGSLMIQAYMSVYMWSRAWSQPTQQPTDPSAGLTWSVKNLTSTRLLQNHWKLQNYEISVQFYLIYGIQAVSISCDISWSWWGPRYNPSAKEAIRWWFHLSLWHQLLRQLLFSLFGIPKWKIALYPDCM